MVHQSSKMANEITLSLPQASFLSSQSPLNLLHCGQGFGKTHVEGLISALMVTRCPKAMGMIGANTYQQLSDATLVRIFAVWKEYFGWTEYTKGNTEGVYVIDKTPPDHFMPHGQTFKSNNQKIYFRNGSVIMTASLDNYMALDGREISWAILDETKDTREMAVKEVILARLRAPGVNVLDGFDFASDFFGFIGPESPRAGIPINPCWIFTSPAKEQWLTTMFDLEKNRAEIENTIFVPEDYYHNEEDGKCVVIASAFWNTHLPKDYIDQKYKYLSKDRIDMLVYGSPFGKTGIEYYGTWNRSIHVKKCTFAANNPIHLCWDFNVNPYMTLVVCQVIYTDNRVKLRVLREFCLVSPKNTIEAACREFEEEYSHLIKAGIFVYGDATGKNTLPIEDAKSFYSVVKRSLYHLLQSDSVRLLKKNVNHRSSGRNTMGRRDFMNKLLAGGYGVDMEVDPSCVNVINDFEHVKEDANGAKDKKKEKINSIMCERYGHTSDAIDGLCTYLWYRK